MDYAEAGIRELFEAQRAMLSTATAPAS
jgi:hypothetical protein